MKAKVAPAIHIFSFYLINRVLTLLLSMIGIVLISLFNNIDVDSLLLRKKSNPVPIIEFNRPLTVLPLIYVKQT